MKTKRAFIPDETKAVIARHIERQRWDRTREIVVTLLLHSDNIRDDDDPTLLMEAIVARSEDFDNVDDLIAYFEYKVGDDLPEQIDDWREIAEEWAEKLRRLLVSDF